jgi:hypothetical protein
MTTYIKLSTSEYPRHIGDIQIDPAGMSDYAEVQWVDKPTINVQRERAYIGAPIQSNGQWLTNWVVTQIPDSEEAVKVRQTRNSKLAETDWRYRRDQTTTPEWDAYCQALRDVPAQTGFPWTIVWPTQPE